MTFASARALNGRISQVSSTNSGAKRLLLYPGFLHHRNLTCTYADFLGVSDLTVGRRSRKILIIGVVIMTRAQAVISLLVSCNIGTKTFVESYLLHRHSLAL